MLPASLHQAIADLLPDRLEFYESWLNPAAMRRGRIGLAALNAVLSFLRQEDHAYREVVEQAGRHAADWTMASQAAGRGLLMRFCPGGLRRRVAIGVARRTVRRTFGGSRAVIRLRRGHGTAEIRNSIFCNVRGPVPTPLCGYYAALVARLFELHRLEARVEPRACRAIGDRSCILDVQVGP